MTTLLKGLGLITVVLWIALPIYWGSVYLLLRYFHQLTILAVDFESPLIGSAAVVGPLLTSTLEKMNLATTEPRLGTDIVNASFFPGGIDQVREAIKLSRYWGAIVAYPNCTSTWRSSINSGNASYDPTGCMGVFISGARFYEITLLYLLPMMNGVAGTVAQQASTQLLSSWVMSNSGNAAALSRASSASQAIGTPVGFFSEDVNPINQWGVAAPFEAALIYLTILSFEGVVWGNAGRQKTKWNEKVWFPHLVLWRIGVPSVTYVWTSLMFTLLLKAFLIPMSGVFNEQSGFIMTWLLNFLTMCALGLTLESMMALLGPELVPFFLIIWIILNITSSFSPIESMEVFYRWFRALPFYNTVQAYKILFYGNQEKHTLGLYYGVLLAIVLINFVGITVFLGVERWREDKAVAKKAAEEQKGKKES